MTDQTPLLQTQGLVLAGEAPLEVGTLQIDSSSLALWNQAGALLPALTHPAAIAEGSIQLRGVPPSELLSRGVAAYFPQRLPLPDNTKVKQALLLSARLVGLGASDVEHALSRARLTTHSNTALGELSRLQHRLLSFAHGVCGDPQIFLLENLYADLDEGDAAVLEGLLDEALIDRCFISVASSGDPESVALAHRAQRVLVAAGNQVLPPVGPESLTNDGFWVTCNENAAALASRLKEMGAIVVRSPRPAVLLVRKVPGSVIYRSALETGLFILDFTPAASARD